MNNPLLSIIIPVYNAGVSIKKITSTILRQDFKDFELILVDDGSTDKTINVLRGIKAKDKRVVLLSKKNGGPSSARNAGLKRAKGKYIQFFDADDRISPDALSTVVGVAVESKSDMVVSGWRIDLRKNGRTISGYKTINPKPATIKGDSEQIKKYVLKSIGTDGTLYNLWNKLFRADIIKDNNITFNEDLRFGEDTIFSLEYFSYLSKLTIIPNTTYYYLTNSDGSVFSQSSLSQEYRLENLKALKTYVGNITDQQTHDLYAWVVSRWLTSYGMLLSMAKLPYKDKISRLKTIAKQSRVVAKNTTYIGIKYFLIHRVILVSSLSTHLLLLVTAVMALLKKSIVAVKSSLK